MRGLWIWTRISSTEFVDVSIECWYRMKMGNWRHFHLIKVSCRDEGIMDMDTYFKHWLVWSFSRMLLQTKMGNWRRFHLIKVSCTVKGVQIIMHTYIEYWICWSSPAFLFTNYWKRLELHWSHGTFNLEIFFASNQFTISQHDQGEGRPHSMTSYQTKSVRRNQYISFKKFGKAIPFQETIPLKLNFKSEKRKGKQWTWLAGCIFWVRQVINWGGRMERFHPPRTLRVTPACPRGHQDLGQVNLALFYSFISAFSARREVFVHLYPVHELGIEFNLKPNLTSSLV